MALCCAGRSTGKCPVALRLPACRLPPSTRLTLRTPPASLLPADATAGLPYAQEGERRHHLLKHELPDAARGMNALRYAFLYCCLLPVLLRCHVLALHCRLLLLLLAAAAPAVCLAL